MEQGVSNIFLLVFVQRYVKIAADDICGIISCCYCEAHYVQAAMSCLLFRRHQRC